MGSSARSDLPLEVEAKVFDFEFAFDRAEFSDRLLQIVLETDEDNSQMTTLKEVKVNSAVLAAKSLIVREMMSSGIRDTTANSPIVLKMQQVEVQPFMDMLKFIYSGALPPILPSSTEAIDSLMALVQVGDKFHCDILVRTALQKLEDACKTPEALNKLLSANLERLRHIPAVEALLATAGASLVQCFKNVEGTWGRAPFLRLSKQSVLVLLKSEQLEANDEDAIFHSARAWVEQAYGTLDERKEAMHELSSFLRFPLMRGETLQAALEVPEMVTSKDRIMEAVWYKTFSTRKRKRELPGMSSLEERQGVAGRIYKQLHCLFDKRDSCLLRSERQIIHGSNIATVADTNWRLKVELKAKEGSEDFRLAVKIQAVETSNLSAVKPTLLYRFLAREWPTGELVAPKLSSFAKRTWDLTEAKTWGYGDLFSMSFEDLLQSSKWFDAEGQLHLVAEIIEAS